MIKLSMVNSHTIIKNILLTIAVVGIFCCLCLVAQAYHLTIQIESEAKIKIETNREVAAIATAEPKDTSPVFIPAEVIAKETETVTDYEPEIKPESEVVDMSDTKKDSTVVTEPIVAVEPVIEVTSPITSGSDFIDELIRLIESETNSFRLANNLAVLSHEPVLKINAEKYSQAMLRDGFMSHTDQTGCDLTCRFEKDGYEASSWGENLATIKFDRALTAEEVADYFMTGWKKSSGHRENLLSSDFTHQGIGVARNNNVVYVSVQFAKLNK